MFITTEYSGYDKSGVQRARGSYLILFSSYKLRNSKDDLRLWACVRTVVMRQSGHWMYGFARIGGKKNHISGSYGADGLTRDYDESIDTFLHELPDDLVHEFWHPKDQGWNSCGSEGPILRSWAIKNETMLRGKKRVKEEV